MNKPVYDGNESAWDSLLELLDLPLSYQPVIATILREERWRKAKKPWAYVATAAQRQMRFMRLLDSTQDDFRRLKTPSEGNYRSRVCQGPDEDIPLSQEDRAEYSFYQSATREAWDHIYDHKIPQWLRDRVEYEEIDWNTVAKYAALKPAMVPSLALALSLRIGQHLTREEAIRRGRAMGHGNKVAAACKWIHRNFETRIAPLFKLESPPHIATPTKAGPSNRSTISAGEVIKQLCDRDRLHPDWIRSPSIKQDQNDLRRYTILQPGTRIWKRDRYGIIDGTPYRTDFR